MSTESQMMVMLAIIGCLVSGLVAYFIGNTNDKFRDIKVWVSSLNQKFDDHIKDCKFQDKRGI